MEAKIWNLNEWVSETDPQILKNKYTEIIKLSGFKIIKFIEHYFNPIGYTAIWLLSESHFAVHTFPEEGKTYIELSSCVHKHFVEFKNIIAIKIDTK